MRIFDGRYSTLELIVDGAECWFRLFDGNSEYVTEPFNINLLEGISYQILSVCKLQKALNSPEGE